MSDLRQALDDYFTLRRALGYHYNPLGEASKPVPGLPRARGRRYDNRRPGFELGAAAVGCDRKLVGATAIGSPGLCDVSFCARPP